MESPGPSLRAAAKEGLQGAGCALPPSLPQVGSGLEGEPEASVRLEAPTLILGLPKPEGLDPGLCQADLPERGQAPRAASQGRKGLGVWAVPSPLTALRPRPSSQQGIGNTFQGGANCIMFVLCTRAVRTRLLSLCCCGCPRPSTQSPGHPAGAPAPSKTGDSREPRQTPEEPPSS